MLPKKILMFLFCLILITSLSTCFMYISTFSFENDYFITEPFLSVDKTTINFELQGDTKNIYFQIQSPGANAFEKIEAFCEEKLCSIPLVIGGSITFELYLRKKLIYSKNFILPQLKMNCTDEPWTNRICTFHDLCYVEGSFIFESPYTINFDSELLCLGSKTPPVDLEMNRLVNKFQTKKLMRFYTIPKIEEPSNLVSIYYNMKMLWHQYFDFLFPLYQTLIYFPSNMSINNLKSFSKKRRIYLPNFVPEIPQITKAFTDFQVLKLNNNLCFREISLGMIKITDLSQDKNNPPYSFCNNCTQGLRDMVLHYHNLSCNSSNRKKIIFLGRNSTKRIIYNEKEIVNQLKSKYPNYDVQLHYFENMSITNQINIVCSANIFISMHGSGLANMLWLPQNALVIEILPKHFTCRDWYEKAARASGLHYFPYYADGINETIEGDETKIKKCLSIKNKCSNNMCIDVLRDQNIMLNLDKFMDKISSFLV